MDTPVVLNLSLDEKRILYAYKDKAARFGLSLDFNESNGVVLCTRAPQCYKDRETSEKYYKRPSSIGNLVNELAKELVQIWFQTKGSLNVLPKSITNVLNSQACRGNLNFN